MVNSSAGMDGKLCLWQASRVVCTDLQHDSTHPVSKIVSDLRHNMALTCTYDGTISIWRFEDAQSSAAGGTNSSRLRANVNRASSSYSPSSYLYGHTQPVTECCFRGNTVVSGDKSGSLLVWDLQQSELLHRFRAHPGPITALESVEDGNIIITCGTDGYVKVWDPRSSGTGLVHKIPSHVITTNGVANDGSRAINPIKKPAGRGSAVSRSSQSVAASAQKVVASAIGCMSTVRNRGSASDVTYIVTGSGGADDSSVAVVDMRSSSPDVLCRFRHHRNGVYSMCVVGDSCVLTGDGVGTMLCYDLIHADPAYNDNVVVQKPAWNGSFGESPSVGMENDSCLKYGIGASEKGAVRAINCLSGKVVTAGEDGNVLVFDYISDRVSYK